MIYLTGFQLEWNRACGCKTAGLYLWRFIEKLWLKTRRIKSPP